KQLKSNNQQTNGGINLEQPSKDNFIFKPLTIYDIDQILHVQQVVVDSLEDPSILATLTRDEFTFMLEGNGAIIGAFADDELIALRAVLEPPIDEEHLGLDIGLTGEALKLVLYQEISMVLPTFRGHGLQQQLATHIMQLVEDSHKVYTHICATVAPTNIPSLKDKFKQGMVSVILKQTYGDKWRYTFAKPIQEEWTFDATETKHIPLDDFNKHIQLLENNWYGVELTEEDRQYFISYQQRTE